MKQTAEVELIPWSHYIETESHRQVIEYIKKMPKNSVIALETTDLRLHYLAKIIEKTKKERWPTFYPAITNKNRSSGSFIDVLVEAQKRNISIKPIEALQYRLKYSKLLRLREEEHRAQLLSKKALDVEKALDKIDFLREKHYANQIQTILKKFNRGELFVLTGGEHANSLQRELKKLGIKSNINKSAAALYEAEPTRRLTYSELRKKLITRTKELKKKIKKQRKNSENRIKRRLAEMAFRRIEKRIK